MPPAKPTSGVTSVSVEPPRPETKPWLSSTLLLPETARYSPPPPDSVPPPLRSIVAPASMATARLPKATPLLVASKMIRLPATTWVPA